jgi:hypothetical protein
MDKQVKAAVQALYELASSVATPEQMLEVAEKFEVEVWAVEGYYFEYVELAGDR